ncbi:MAG: hypothetical protein A3D67_02505 [Candidatus Lloydbacteria bacterium RIFCSPHIGHO2_02_FULL_51_22]|uniref:Uncharacterized protein n=2 Tax=Candidatus Lloydiibacteriota TaxID=1817910 RepID=A0A1G2DGM5_9BACT|nr:MAG: hypothetical protein A3D67_02505 [Candidatus Lloydbacteria bacterium RIFCSPHIGHO2_02_FULL_51_22]OGZ15906.1 MAG: hypothetical protein A3G11_02310 [Candidatus Lloydbacteria bacterium RIFCSPLOWO2_12_FULL_51_9]
MSHELDFGEELLKWAEKIYPEMMRQMKVTSTSRGGSRGYVKGTIAGKKVTLTIGFNDKQGANHITWD